MPRIYITKQELLDKLSVDYVKNILREFLSQYNEHQLKILEADIKFGKIIPAITNHFGDIWNYISELDLPKKFPQIEILDMILDYEKTKSK